MREEIERHVRHSSAITDELREILEPVQVAKFFVWVEQNQKKLLSSMEGLPTTEAPNGAVA